MGHSLRHHCWRHISLYRVYPAQSLLSARCIQTAYHPYGFPILFSVNGTEFQRHVCQCIHGHRYETGQLPECHPEQLVHAGLPHRRYSHYLAQRKRRTLQISLCRRFPSIGAFRHVHVFRGTRCRTVRTDEVSGHHPFYRYDVPLFADSNLRHPTHALQISFFLDMYHAYRTHGIGSQHRSRTLYECTARTPTALRHPLCTECRHAAPRSIHLVYPDRTRYAISGKEQTRSNQHGCHIHQRTHPSAGHPLCCKGNGRMDTLRLLVLHDICACRAVS